jgi:crotonobetaine/carnitine-CoA ligase
MIAPLHHWAGVAEDRPFLDFTELDGTVTSFTYGELYDRVRRLAAGLAVEGLRPGDRCIVHTGNTVGFMLALFAVLEAGAVAVPTIVQYSADELRYVIRHSGAWGVVTREDLLGTVREAIDGSSCRMIVEGSPLDALAAAGDPQRARGGGEPGDVALILYTSGTTSRPKGVMLGSAGSIYTGLSYAQHLRLRPDDVTLTCMPLFHVNGLCLQMMPTLVSGARFVLTPRFSASRYWSWVRAHDVTLAHLINGPIRLLLSADERPGDRDHRVRAMTFGLPLTDGEICGFEARFGIPLAMVWGLTETCCGATLMPLGFGSRSGHQNIGPALIGWQVRVAGEDLRELPDGDVGELLVRSPGVMLGYYRDPDLTARTVRDGWVRTGDLGYRDDGGYFHFVDRIKDMVKPSGENVAASEIEDVITAHPAVSECAVLGIPDQIRSETVIALVVPVVGASIAPEEVQSFCRERLASFKVPSVVELRAALPKTSIGKIRKGDLRDELRRG